MGRATLNDRGGGHLIDFSQFCRSLCLFWRVIEGYGVDIVLIGIPHGPPVFISPTRDFIPLHVRIMRVASMGCPPSRARNAQPRPSCRHRFGRDPGKIFGLWAIFLKSSQGTQANLLASALLERMPRAPVSDARGAERVSQMQPAIRFRRPSAAPNKPPLP